MNENTENTESNENCAQGAQDPAGAQEEAKGPDAQAQSPDTQGDAHAAPPGQDQDQAAGSAGAPQEVTPADAPDIPTCVDGPGSDPPYKVQAQPGDIHQAGSNSAIGQDPPPPISGSHTAISQHEGYLRRWIDDLERFTKTAEHDDLCSAEKIAVALHLNALYSAVNTVAFRLVHMVHKI